jgi:putative ABC transport system substrate-binding protein
MINVGRREFITLLGGAAAWPVVARAQKPARLPTIGFLGTATSSAWSEWVAAFVRRLSEHGWIEGSTIAIEYRWAEGRSERLAEIAAELIRLKVDIIVTSGTGVAAAKQATSVIPIVFAVAVDPVGSGFVASLARPGGNVTGLSIQSHDVVGKRLELLRELIPGLRHLAITGNGGYFAAVEEMGEAQVMATGLGLSTDVLEFRGAADIEPVFERIKGRAEAVYLVTESVANANRVRINALALAARLPMISGFREFATTGGLVSYGASYPDLFRRAGDFVDKILRGAKPADLPVEQPTKFELAFNLVTAKALGLAVSPMLFARADEVIE